MSRDKGKLMDFHPIADIFPLLDGAEFSQLVADVQRNGVLEPIVVHEGKVLDGRNRYRAAERAGASCPSVRWGGECGDPISFVVSRNIQRRQLTSSQRAMCADRARRMYDEQAKMRKRGGQGGKLLPVISPEAKGDARDHLGRAFGVSGSTVDRARKLRTHGSPMLIEAVEAGKIGVWRAVEMLDATEDEIREEMESSPPQLKANRAPAAKPSAAELNGKMGKGVILANEAINCLCRIPHNDPLRKRGFQIVMDWLRANMKERQNV